MKPQEYAGLFPREEHAVRAAEYLEGLLYNGRATSAEPMMLARYGGESAAVPAEAVASGLAPRQSKRYALKEGARRTIGREFAAVRMVNVREKLPGGEVWRVLRRDLRTREVKAFVSNAPARLPLKHLARISGMRWPNDVD